MNSLEAFAMGEANRGKELMVFDWDKAALLIKQRNPVFVEAGLEGDLEWTGGTIHKNGEIVEDSYTYLSSTWATPIIIIDGEEIDCYIMESKTSWNESTKWPESSRKILA